jgi:hypothetical protein
MMYELFRVAATGTAPGVPTVECYSERDTMVLVSSTERVPRGPEIHVPPPMPGGHSPHREDPEGVAALIADAVEYVLRARRRPTAATPGDGSATLLRGGAEPDGEVTQMVTWATGVLAGLRRPSGRTLAAGAVLAGAAAAAAGVALGRRAPRPD